MKNNRNHIIKNKKTIRKREYRKKCEYCQTFSKAYRMFDIDGTNLVEHLVCLECRAGAPAIKY